MESQLKKALNLVRRIGSHLIVYNLGRDKEAYVVMSLEEYERLVLKKSEVRGLTEDELLAKINRDIAIWKSEQEEKFKDLATEADFGLENAKVSEKDDFNEKDDLGFYRPQFDNYNQETKNSKKEQAEVAQADNNKSKKKWVIPSERKQGAEEIIEEDMQYLEEI